MSSSVHPAIARIRAEHGDKMFGVLGSDLSGADLTAVLLEVAKRRAAALSPTNVLDQYERDRFVRPAPVDGRRMIDTERRAIAAVGAAFEVLVLAPLSPLGTHSVVAGVHQHRVVTTMRGSEVAADPTNALALEAAVRRRSLLRLTPRSTDWVSLASVQRVSRAQLVDGPMSFAHFSLLGMVIAGRDTGSASFERASLVSLLSAMVSVINDAGTDRVDVTLTDFSGRMGHVMEGAADRLGRIRDVQVLIDNERSAGQGYYPSLCFTVHAVVGDQDIEVGDGGFVPWTQRLLSNSKERLLIGGIGLDRLAIARPDPT